MELESDGIMLVEGVSDKYVEIHSDDDDDYNDDSGDQFIGRRMGSFRKKNHDSKFKGIYGKGFSNINATLPRYSNGIWNRPKWWRHGFIDFLPLTLSATTSGYLIGSLLHRYYFYVPKTRKWYHRDYFNMTQKSKNIPPETVRFTEQDLIQNLKNQKFIPAELSNYQPSYDVMKQLQRDGRLIQMNDKDQKFNPIGELDQSFFQSLISIPYYSGGVSGNTTLPINTNIGLKSGDNLGPSETSRAVMHHHDTFVPINCNVQTIYSPPPQQKIGPTTTSMETSTQNDGINCSIQ
jgi:hypothetical protein